MKLFSERKGIEPPKLVQSDDMDQPLRNKLWSVFYDYFFRFWSDREMGRPTPLAKHISQQLRWFWVNLLNNTSDSYPGDEKCVQRLRKVFVCDGWDKVYSAVELCLTRIHGKNLISAANAVLEHENSGYRIVEGKVTDIISPQEIHEIEQAASAAPSPVRAHLDAAVRYLSITEKRDYRNSIKESISAVESLCRLAGGASLEEGLRKLKKKIKIHPALEQAFYKTLWLHERQGWCATRINYGGKRFRCGGTFYVGLLLGFR
jgi:hypothetical protein